MEALIRDIGSATATQSQNVFNTYSPLWAGLFSERQKKLSEQTLATFLSPSSRQTSGVAGQSSDLALFSDFYSALVPRDLLAAHPLSLVGEPRSFDFEGHSASVSHLENLAVYNAMREMTAAPVRDVIEIGAGYGCMASFLMRGVRSYTIIDLPENLVNSAYFLSRNFPNIKITLATNGNPCQQEGIILVMPGHIDALRDYRFDFAINTDSLGEMRRDTAIAYVAWIYDHLQHGGLFFTKNGHRRGNARGVRTVSEYGYQRFELAALRPAIAASSIFDDFSHLALLRKGRGMTGEQVQHLDTLANLYALGLHAELIGISHRLSNESLSADDLAFLSFAADYFASGETQYAGPYSNCAAFMRGMLGCANGAAFTPHLQAYLKSPLSFAAEVYSNLLILSQPVRPLGFSPSCSGPASRYFMREVDSIERLSFPLRHLAYRIRLDNLRKKVRLDWTPSVLTRAKNVAVNLRELRLSASR